MLYSSGADLGIGISYMNAIGEHIAKNIEIFDFIEAYSERFFIRDDNSLLNKIIKNKPVVLHGLDLSLGTPGNLDEVYCNKLASVINETNCCWFSDHISLTKIENIEVGHLMPICFNDENIELIVSKIKALTKNITTPFLLENITYYYQIPNSDIKEADFISCILHQADCGMLLDLNNLYLNSLNHNYDPYEYLKKIPLERVVEIHLAGGSFKENMHVDTHANSISKEVWDLFEYVAKTVPFRGVIIERDANFEPFSEIIEEVKFARSIMKKYRIERSRKML
ncbi:MULTISPECIES: DUF692 domain-containing protein [Legionella]|uniref:DUF692 domain-containing protein n=1 Tax=Legionella drozanskii LLAP-1 TaxID=1212489 RepID=A0A0W0TC25_9GAMM|nr:MULTISPECIES: DUF692 family multinuclear iron-containing protein [Legionella]KTC93172.1 hypothetical protein Ldro_0543 [Legionella drozanskii LLAP-1]PJE14178.1 MAG: DUF692 domain-containing protein [Legionella sp.]